MSFRKVKSLTSMPISCKADATLRTVVNLNLRKAYTESIVQGAEQKDQLIAQRLTTVTDCI